MIPALVPGPEGYPILPPGRHQASLTEIEASFVAAAPNADHRAFIWQSATLHLQRMRRLLGPCDAWIDGGFVTLKPDPPHDVDIAYFAPGAAIHNAYGADPDGFVSLITLQDLIVGTPGPVGLKRLQPMGSHVDSFVTPIEDAARADAWNRIWSLVKGADGKIIPGAAKGYLEVRLP